MFSYHPSIFLSGTNLHNTLPIYNERVISQVKVNYIQFFQHIMEMKYTFYNIRYISTQYFFGNRMEGWET